MPEPLAPTCDHPADLISFLRSLPDGRMRHGIRYPQWFLLLVSILGILSGYRSSRDLERFARRHRSTINQSLGLDLKRWPTDATFLYLYRFAEGFAYNKAHLREFGKVLQGWMLAQIPGGAEALDELVCDGKTLRASAVEAADGSNRFVAQVTVYSRAPGVAMAQTAYDTGESNERKVLQELLSEMDLEGVLIQTDALHTTKSFLRGATPSEKTSSTPRGPTCS